MLNLEGKVDSQCSRSNQFDQVKIPDRRVVTMDIITDLPFGQKCGRLEQDKDVDNWFGV